MNRTEQFRFTDIVWHEVPMEKSILNSNAVEYLLNKNLNLKNYTEEFDFIFFIFIIDLPNSIHDEVKRVYRKKRYIDLELKLDYIEVMSATPEEVRQMMAALFLNSILLYPKMRLKNFDYQRLYDDVKALFEENGLLKKNEELELVEA